jgi:hypothetical protein
VRVDEKRSFGVAAFDVEQEVFGFRLLAEAHTAKIELPPALEGFYAQRQTGGYVELVRDVARGFQRGLPNSSLALKVRFDAVDFDRDLEGDAVNQISVGANYRPTPDTVIKFDFVRGRSWDRFNNMGEFAKLLASVATYF